MDFENRHIIFPTNSPVDVSGGEKVKAPKTLKRGLFERNSALRDRKFAPLLKAKEEADKVYSNGYFENHYKDADKTLKTMLHDKVMDAWANTNGYKKKKKEEDVKEGKGLSLTISVNLGGLGG
jgi:hypothetical protein